MTQAVDSVSGTIALAYDSLDRLQRAVTPQDQVVYAYDADQRTSMTVLNQSPVTYGYDAANRLRSVTQGAATVGLDYDDANRRTSLMLPNGVGVTYAYKRPERRGRDQLRAGRHDARQPGVYV